MTTEKKYLPALSIAWLTPFYDALFEAPLAMLRKSLVSTAGAMNGCRVLDVGSGTGSLTLLIKEIFPSADVFGLDGDQQILDIARLKAIRKGLVVNYDQAMSYDLPYPDGHFDIVFTSLMLHHLEHDDKLRTAREMFRVLHKGRRLVGADFGEWSSPLGRLLKPFARNLERAAENLDGYLPELFRTAGFTGFQEIRRYWFGTISLFQALKT